MIFKIKNTTFKVSFSFFAILLIFTVADKSNLYLKTLFYGILHESIHLWFISRYSSPPQMVELSIFGGDIKRASDNKTTFPQEVAINISAPLFNLILAFFFYMLSFLSKMKLHEDMTINLTLGLFNLLPYYNFDGGNALKNILMMRFSVDTSEKIITAFSALVSALFALVSVYIFINYKKNYILLIFSLYMLLMIIFKK